MGRPINPFAELVEKYDRGICRGAEALERIADELTDIRRLLVAQAASREAAGPPRDSMPGWALKEELGLMPPSKPPGHGLRCRCCDSPDHRTGACPSGDFDPIARPGV